MLISLCNRFVPMTKDYPDFINETKGKESYTCIFFANNECPLLHHNTVNVRHSVNLC